MLTFNSNKIIKNQRNYEIHPGRKLFLALSWVKMQVNKFIIVIYFERFSVFFVWSLLKWKHFYFYFSVKKTASNKLFFIFAMKGFNNWRIINNRAYFSSSSLVKTKNSLFSQLQSARYGLWVGGGEWCFLKKISLTESDSSLMGQRKKCFESVSERWLPLRWEKYPEL